MASSVVIIVLIVLALLVGGFVYFTVISPSGEKHVLENPLLGSNDTVSVQHVAWLANEIGAYKIHSSPTGEPAVFSVNVEGVEFSVTSADSLNVTQGATVNPDLRIIASRNAFAQIMDSQNVTQTITRLYSSGEISVAVEKDEATLALKGYKAIYDELAKG